MTLVIFGDSFTFPEGNAATNHAYTYARGFLKNGIGVHVICFESSYIDSFDGITDGIKYYHAFRQRERSRFFIIRRWHNLQKYIRAYNLVRGIKKEDKIIALSLWSYLFSTQLFAYFLARYAKTKLIIERSEHPLRYYKTDNSLQQFYGNFKVALEIKLYDGIFCISNYLINFYKKKGFSSKKLFLVPSTVDTERFNRHFNSKLPYDYMLYCGALTIQKDGVNILIESFRKISQKHHKINLVLIGKGESFNDDERVIRDLAARVNMVERIIFLGQISRTEVPAYMCNAKILVLARPKSILADAGFPSKLTEYLATGKPVVVTKVGEIPLCLTDNENAFIAEPDSIDAFADKLDYVLENYEFARQVGEKGKELTATIFNYNFQAKRMIDFIKSL